jgi:hypothetical protein
MVRVNGYRGPLQGIKRPEPAVNHSPLSSGEVKNERIYISTPLKSFHGADRKK